MLTMLRKRIDSEEDGFTLIELMVVVMIIAILMAIAIPTFLGASTKAKDRAAQSDLRNGLTAAKTLSVDQAGLFLRSDGVTPLDKADLSGAEPSLSFDNATATTSLIFVYSDHVADGAAGANIVLVKQTASGTKFYGIATSSSGVITKCWAAALATINTATKCGTQPSW